MMNENQAGEAQIDTSNLYREDSFTDLKVGSIRRLVPVTPDGDPDTARPTLYRGQAAMMTPAGQLPLHFELPGDSLSVAIAGFGAALEAEAERMMEELRDLQRKQEMASPIIQTPGQGAGKIQL